MAFTREQFTTTDKQTVDHFDCKWEFVNTFLTHADVDDPEQIVRDLAWLVRGLNT